MISDLFSRPVINDENYYSTQYICEYIKHLGFDGIRFKSSLDSNGKNYVLFNSVNNTSKGYSIINSKVFQVDSIEINYNQVVPITGKRL